jgi:hypothetical protein
VAGVAVKVTLVVLQLRSPDLLRPADGGVVLLLTLTVAVAVQPLPLSVTVTV